VKTANWISNMIFRSDDVNYINKPHILIFINITDVYASLLFPKTGNVIA